MQNRIKDYMTLMKLRIVVMQLVTFSLGFFLNPFGEWTVSVFVMALLGTFLSASGAAALNHYIERKIDAKMERTRDRPIPTGRISALVAGLFGLSLVLSGAWILWMFVNTVTAYLSFITAFLYVLVYTPFKQMSWINTFIGAVPGALPPLAGWVAAGAFSGNAWVMFWVLYFWQLPHFFAIAWMCREDYSRAGFQMLSTDDPSGNRTFLHMMVYAGILLLVSVLPVTQGMLSWVYGVVAIGLGVWFLWRCYQFRKDRSVASAKRIMLASILYLPLLLIVILLDKVLS
jgi:protoheme IX farnesyltransferase